MTREFEMTDLGLMRFFLGLEVRQEEQESLYYWKDMQKNL